MRPQLQRCHRATGIQDGQVTSHAPGQPAHRFRGEAWLWRRERFIDFNFRTALATARLRSSLRGLDAFHGILRSQCKDLPALALEFSMCGALGLLAMMLRRALL
jgi:hypothetical protein